MDPVSQFALGAALPLALERGAPTIDRVRAVFIAGALGGLLPDLDVLIRSPEDPLLAIQFHRHFTHSLFFAPVVGGVVAIVLRFFFKRRRTAGELWKWATLGALTHGLLDACTSYGTHLLWPLSGERVAWHIVSIVDPLYTLPLLGFVLATFFGGRTFFAKIGLILSLAYLGLGLAQRERAAAFYLERIAERGESVARLEVKPSFGNLWLWRGVYLSGDEFVVDAVRVPPGEPGRLYPGGRTKRLRPDRDFARLPADSTARRDLERFNFFSDGFLYAARADGRTLGDLRFSLLPNSLEPLWVVELDDTRPERHLPYETVREVTPEKRARFWKMITGADL